MRKGRLPVTGLLAGCILAAALVMGAGGEDAYQRARLSSLEGRWDAAIEEYLASLQAEPRGSLADDALYWLAVGYRQVGRFDDSLAAAARLEREFPESPFRDDVLLLEGKVLEENLGHAPEAAAVYRRLRRLDPPPIPNISLEARTRLGDLELEEQRLEPALEEYSKVQKEAARQEAMPQQRLSLQADVAAERETFARENYDFDGAPLSLYLEADRLARTGRCAEAVGILDRVMRKYPGSQVVDDALLLLGDCHGRLGDAGAAARAYERLSTEFRNSPAHRRFEERKKKVRPLKNLIFF